MIKCFGDLVQTYGVMVAQQILVLLVEVRIPIGLQASEEFSSEAFFFFGYNQSKNSFYSLLKKINSIFVT